LKPLLVDKAAMDNGLKKSPLAFESTLKPYAIWSVTAYLQNLIMVLSIAALK
jgi:hypothetical protein